MINHTGYEILSEVDGVTSIEKIVTRISQKYSLSEKVIRKDISEFFHFLADEGLLVWEYK